MFTGIVETKGTVESAQTIEGDVRIVISATALRETQIDLGDSVAIDGVCLTVIDRDRDSLAFDVSVESLNHTLIGDWVAGKQVNLELAMLPTTRMGGHMVSGHVDGLAQLVKLEEDARSWRMEFQAPAALRKFIAPKGSVTLNGTSLTVNSVTETAFDVNIIPHTYEVTTLGDLCEGDSVHLEVDLIARYLDRLLEERGRNT